MSLLLETIELFIDQEPHSAPLNMAIDEVLLRHATNPLLRFYQWARPSVSFGYFESSEAVEKAYPDKERVRRWTGGGVVLHGEDLTYSLLVPIAHPFACLNTSESYRTIHNCIAEAVRAEGIGATVAAAPDPKISQACFENAAQYDILSRGRKIAGAAQRRTRFGLLHQGSIQSINLPPSLPTRIALAFSPSIVERQITDDELEEAGTLSETKYATEDWMRKF